MHLPRRPSSANLFPATTLFTYLLLLLFTYTLPTISWTLNAYSLPNYTGSKLLSITGDSNPPTNDDPPSNCYSFPTTNLSSHSNTMQSYQWNAGRPDNCYLFVYEKSGCSGIPFIRIWRGATTWYVPEVNMGKKARSFEVGCVQSLG